MSEVIGVKHDGGKPWAGTVLAGFWPQLRGLFHDQALDDGDGDLGNDDLQGWCEALDVFFDASLAIPDRLVKAAKHLTDHTSAAAYLPHVIDVGTYGARKYARDNWLHVEGGVERYYEAVGRHVRDIMLGDWRDEESGCVNLGHIAWGILAGAELVRRTVADAATADQPAAKRALALPLEVGKYYRLFRDDDVQGLFVCERSEYDGSEGDVVIDEWYFRSSDGIAPGVEDSVTLTGPVEP